ncbi:MAG: response regulator [Burkholderiales bacterium]|nr:response regulator [Burkholderiales bacterium]
MVTSTRVALLGFGRIEHAAFEAFFRIAGRRCPAYAQEADFRAADFVIVDAADEPSRAAVRAAGLVARTVALGMPALEGALLQLARPLNLMQVVRALDEVVAHDTPLEADTVREGQVVARPDDEVPTEADAAIGVDAGAEPEDSRARRRKGEPMDHVLVVDDSEVALRFMATHLQRFGFQIHLAKSGEEALRRVAERRFEFVFLDVRMEGLDGFQTCKAIKRAHYAPGQEPPAVVMLTCLAGAADRLRGTMAGADAYLTKPLRELELLKVVGEREIARHAYAATAAASTLR